MGATGLGKIIKGLMGQNDLSQKQLAEELDVSASILSNYLTGKNIPEMEFLAKCVDRFALKGKDLKNLFDKAFSISVQSSQKIVLDTRYFKKDRLDTLRQILMVLLLDEDCPSFKNFFETIKEWYDAMENNRFLELVRPSQDVMDNSEQGSSQVIHGEPEHQSSID
jgi:transcriptional regulator with XRE-family HTH domain